ncbi:MAG TPA: MFS transporter, partial [Steroidobacteraceae bacterium]|nr:MFS transporter [Steroidobacteraceae bacterium]
MSPAAHMRTALPRTVIVLGWVSLLNDAASEMITPLLPIFLTATLGAGPAIVGLVEGVAEATASVLKLWSGRLVDRGVDPKRLIVGGYGCSNLARPLIGLALAWGWVLSL